MLAIPAFSERTWKIIGSLAGLFVVLLLVLFTLDRCGKSSFDTQMQKANANLSNAIDQLSNIQQQKQQLDIEEARQKQIVIEAAKDANEAAKVEANAAVVTNQAIGNVNAVNARDFNGTDLANANRARCRAFPDSPECK